MGLIDQAAMDVFFFYETQGLNPVMAILADTLMSMEECHKKDGGQLRCCNHLLYVWIITHLYASDRLGYSPDPFRKFHRIDVKEQSAKQWRDDFARYEAKFFPWLSGSSNGPKLCPEKKFYEEYVFNMAWTMINKNESEELGTTSIKREKGSLEGHMARSRKEKEIENLSAEVKKMQQKIEMMEEEVARVQTEKEDLEKKGQEKDQTIEQMKEKFSAEEKKMQDKIETMEEEMAKIQTEKQHLEMKGQEKDQKIEQMKEELQQAQAEAESYTCLSKDYSNAMMEAGQKENLLERQLKKLKTERDQLRYEIERLEPVEDEKCKWKVHAEHDHEKREEMMKSYENMMDIVQTHATNLATRVYEANEEINSNPGMMLPWKIFKLVKYCQDLTKGFPEH
ncbi:hypothetical protein SESBI_38937 [Sesbania bispinosa]|nr:hypothetical protein SESBI_38937 [Sesbania bispinosa]